MWVNNWYFMEWLLVGAMILSSIFAAVLLVLHIVTTMRSKKHANKNTVSEQQFTRRQQTEARQQSQEALQLAIKDNVAVLQRDVQAMSEKLTEHMKQEVSKTLREEIALYKKSATEVKAAALEAIRESTEVFQKQQGAIDTAIADSVAEEKKRLSENLDEKIADILQHYVSQVLEDQITPEDQLGEILAQLDQHKAAIVEDIQRGV